MQYVNSEIIRKNTQVTPQQSPLKLNSNQTDLDPVDIQDQQSGSQLKCQDTCKLSTEVTPQDQQSFNSTQIKLFVSRNNELQHNFNEEGDARLARLVDEYKTKTNCSSCDDEACRNLRTLTYKLLQTLFDKINSQTIKPLSQIAINTQNVDCRSETMDQNALTDMVVEKDKRIHDLEKQLEIQKKLRMQDANQVEEKAARIKEWVANKLKELENQNRQLREQNKKQKETVDTLNHRLATFSQLSTLKRAFKTDITQVIDRLTSVSQNDIECNQLSPVAQSRKKSFDSIGFRRSNLENQPCFSKVSIEGERTDFRPPTNSRENKSSQFTSSRTESPVYDSVSFDKINQEGAKLQNNIQKSITIDSVPPPPPLHQRDKWELELYSLADQIFSSLIKKPSDDSYIVSDLVMNHNTYTEHRASRKSITSVRNDLISLVKPNLTTIDGNNVFDDNSIEEVLYPNEEADKISDEWNQSESKSKFVSSENEREYERTKQEMENQPLLVTFDSPLRSRLGKDCLLKTQSIRRSIESERLFNFISSDLVKRGCLVKPGTLKNHLRWIVLKNFHLNVYKNEVDELSKLKPITVIRLNSNCSIQQVNQSGDVSFPFKILHNEKCLQLIADSSMTRDEWIRILTVTINMSDIESQMLTKQNASCEGLLSITRQGHTKRCYAVLINHIVFFLRSMIDPTPLGYLSVRAAKIRETINNFDHNLEDTIRNESSIQDCSLAIYPRFSLNLDPLYLTNGSEQDTDKWLHYLTIASGTEQSYGTSFEQTLTRFMINRSIARNLVDPYSSSGIEGSLSIRYTDQPITESLTTLPNETLLAEALELFKSILLITKVPIEPKAIDYHVSLIQNCLGRFLKFPELRNEFFAQLLKQSNYVPDQSVSPKLSSSSSGCSVEMIQHHRTSNPATPQSHANHDTSESSSIHWKNFAQCSSNSLKEKDYNYNDIATLTPTQNELLQVMQIIAIAVSLNLPKGRIRWWLINLLNKIAHPSTDIGKYSLYTLRAIDRTNMNGSRENIPSRTEILSIILRNPYDHSHPHSLPVSFSDGSYVVVEADGSTTVEEFITTLVRNVDIRESLSSDFYLFADDPSGSKDLHILEPYRKVLDIVGWWEQTFRMNNYGKYENTKVIKLLFKKRLVLKTEDGETHQERLLIVHQFHQEVTTQKIHLNDNLIMELSALLSQLTYGNISRLESAGSIDRIMEKVVAYLLPKHSSQTASHRNQVDNTLANDRSELENRWRQLADKSPEDCVRVYLNCIRRLNLCLDNLKQVSK